MPFTGSDVLRMPVAFIMAHRPHPSSISGALRAPAAIGSGLGPRGSVPTIAGPISITLNDPSDEWIAADPGLMDRGGASRPIGPSHWQLCSVGFGLVLVEGRRSGYRSWCCCPWSVAVALGESTPRPARPRRLTLRRDHDIARGRPHHFDTYTNLRRRRRLASDRASTCAPSAASAKFAAMPPVACRRYAVRFCPPGE